MSSWGSLAVRQTMTISCFFPPLWGHGLSHLNERVTLYSGTCNYILHRALTGLRLLDVIIFLPTQGCFCQVGSSSGLNIWDNCIKKSPWPHMDVVVDWLSAAVFTAVGFNFYDSTWHWSCPSSIFKKSPNIRPSHTLGQAWPLRNLITLSPRESDVIVVMVCPGTEPQERHNKGLNEKIVNGSNPFSNNCLLSWAKFLNFFHMSKGFPTPPPLSIYAASILIWILTLKHVRIRIKRQVTGS